MTTSASTAAPLFAPENSDRKAAAIPCEVAAAPAGQSLDGHAAHARLRASVQQWCEQRPEGHVYVLLDPAHPASPDEDLDEHALRARPSARRVERVQRPDLAHEPDRLPRLLQLHAAHEHGLADEALLDATLGCALRRCRSIHGAYVAGWLFTTAAPEVLATHLASAGVLFDVRRGRERFVPLFEPHALALWHDTTEWPDRLRHWFGPIERWGLIDGGGQWRLLERPPEPVSPTSRGSRVLAAQDAIAQARIGTARCVLSALTRAGIVLAERPEQRLDRAVARALAHGLRDTEDIVFHALNDFTLGPGWSAHPQAAEFIARSALDPQRGLAAQFQELPDAVLDDIANVAPSR